MKRAILATALALLLAGCSEQQIDHAGDAIASDAPKIANDAITVGKIEAKFAQIDASSALHVAVSSHDGDVKLSGKVKSAAVSQKFESAAKDVDGVKKVDASLTVDPALPSAQAQVGDFALMAAVRANLAGQAGVNAFAIGVKAHAGTVTLAGKVKSEALRATLAATAKSTSGVKNVVDDITVAQ